MLTLLHVKNKKALLPALLIFLSFPALAPAVSTRDCGSPPKGSYGPGWAKEYKKWCEDCCGVFSMPKNNPSCAQTPRWGCIEPEPVQEEPKVNKEEKESEASRGLIKNLKGLKEKKSNQEQAVDRLHDTLVEEKKTGAVDQLRDSLNESKKKAAVRRAAKTTEAENKRKRLEDFKKNKKLADRYEELRRLYNFADLSELEEGFKELEKTHKELLRYFIQNVAAKLDKPNDAVMVAWWSEIEWVFRFGGPWTFTNCEGTGEGSQYAEHDCRGEHWQAGYGLQVQDNYAGLKKVFKHFYGEKQPKEIGDIVLQNAGITNLKFPSDIAWKDLTNTDIIENINNSGKSNHFWASILMRDPLLSAYLEAPNLRPGKFVCYQPEHPRYKSWCQNSYTAKRKEQSESLLSILKAWSELE